MLDFMLFFTTRERWGIQYDLSFCLFRGLYGYLEEISIVPSTVLNLTSAFVYGLHSQVCNVFRYKVHEEGRGDVKFDHVVC